MKKNHGIILCSLFLFSACCPTFKPDAQVAPKITADKQIMEYRLERKVFNRLAAKSNIPIFWEVDDKNPGVITPQELAIVGVTQAENKYVAGGTFTDEFFSVYAYLVEQYRHEIVEKELDQGRPTLVKTDLSGKKDWEKQFVKNIIAAANIIEDLYALQEGAFKYKNCAKDPASQALFARNQGPWCQAPATDSNPFCNACSTFPEKESGLYPHELQRDKDFCQKIGTLPQAKELFHQFSVIKEVDGKLQAVPYNNVFTEPMHAVSDYLKKAAMVIPSNEERALFAYLNAAAQSFIDNDWEPANEAWAAMNATNSSWYLRIAPDEVYYEPCNRKAGFHVSFALIDKDSLYWQEKLTPYRQTMEDNLSELVGEAYTAREVKVHMPDFIEIVLNAGDARSALGATIGQSLPNWGPVAQEGRGRTVVMTNLYTDPDSKKVKREQADSLLSLESMSHFAEEKMLTTLDIILHEITHNFGPHSDYAIDGRRPGDIFGGALATVLEELKAQTGALYFVSFLRKHDLLTDEQVKQVYNHSITWTFGHIARGMFSGSGKPKPYSQLAAIQVGFLMKYGALSWEANDFAANGKDKGRFTIHYEKFPEIISKLMAHVCRIKATGDVQAAKTLIDEFVVGPQSRLVHMPEIKKRLSRYPKESFIYNVTF